MRDTVDRFITGFIGTASPLAGAVISLQNIEATLRIVSLIVGIAVGVASLIRLWIKR